jgi:RNA polymerase sigma factor (sigma-70 family)
LIDYHYLCRHFIGRFSANGLISKERTKCLSNDNDYRGDITNKLMLALTKWDGRGSLYAYIYSQAEYGHKIYVKKRNKIKELNNQQSFDDTAIDKDFAPEIELTDYVDNILDELPEEDRLIITLKFWGKLSGRKISKEIGRSRQYIKSRTNYLLSQMRDKNDQIAI